MTAPAIVMRRSADPTTCMCCGRHAASIGVCKPRAACDTWTCERVECQQATQRMILMTPNELNAYERRATEAVARAFVEPVLQRAMQAMANAGATDLTALTAEQVDMAMEGFIVNGEMAATVRDLVLAFGDHIRADVVNNAPPF